MRLGAGSVPNQDKTPQDQLCKRGWRPRWPRHRSGAAIPSMAGISTATVVESAARISESRHRTRSALYLRSAGLPRLPYVAESIAGSPQLVDDGERLRLRRTRTNSAGGGVLGLICGLIRARSAVSASGLGVLLYAGPDVTGHARSAIGRSRKRVAGNRPRVQIPPPPPLSLGHTFAWARSVSGSEQSFVLNQSQPWRTTGLVSALTTRCSGRSGDSALSQGTG